MKTLILASALALAAGPVWAQLQCWPTEEVTRNLTEKYGESIQSQGFDDRGLVLQIWANVDTGTWSAVVLRPDGLSCALGSGTAFRRTDNPPEAMGEES